MAPASPIVDCSVHAEFCLQNACVPSHWTAYDGGPGWLQDWLDSTPHLIPARFGDFGSGDVKLALWCLALLLPVVAWLGSAIAVPRGPSALRRAAAGMGPAALTLVALLVAARLVFSLPVAHGVLFGKNSLTSALAGAARWTDLPDHVASCLVPVVLPSELLLIAALACGLLLVVLAPLFTFHHARKASPLRVPGGGWTGLPLAVAAVLVPLVLAPALDLAGIQATFLELAGALPILCGAFAIWTLARREPTPGPAKVVELPAPAPAPVVDASAVWKQIGALASDAVPFFGVGPVSLAPADPGLQHVWEASLGAQLPPRALDESIKITETPFHGALIADAPRLAEDTLLVATVLHAVAVGAASCLVVVDDRIKQPGGKFSSAIRDRYLAALSRSGYWEPSTIPLGYEELNHELSGGKLPVLAFVDIDELSEQGIAAFWGTTGVAAGPAYARHLKVVVVPRIDQGSALRVAHRFWTLRRLCLALRAAGSDFRVVTTGFGSDETLALARNAFAGYVEMQRIEYQPRSVETSRVWVAREQWVSQGPTAWPVRASEPLLRSGLEIGVDDPLGHVDGGALEAISDRVGLTRGLAFAGVASVAQLEGAWLFAALRAFPNRTPHAESALHDALWSFELGPTTRFALQPNVLRALLDQRRLPAPSPLVAARNLLVQSLHLTAALAEGEQDIESLRAVFDDRAMVNDAVKTLSSGRHVLRGLTGQGSFLRVELLAHTAERAQRNLRETVGDFVVSIDALGSGEAIMKADAITAPTRFYGGRVFAHGARRYEVPLESDPKTGHIRVRIVEASRPLTRPKLAIELRQPVEEPGASDLELLFEARSGAKRATRLRCATYRALVSESVHGIVTDDGRMVQRYAPLQSSYPTRVRRIAFRTSASANVLLHLAALVDDVLRYMLAADRDAFAVVPTDGALFGTPALPGILVVDRSFQSAGVADALPAERLSLLLEWVRAILSQCTCSDGCPLCTPAHVLEAGGDKAGVLALLGG